jgi:site-specific recombinase XerC
MPHFNLIIPFPSMPRHRIGASAPLAEIQGVLGHKNIATTMIHVETSLDAKRKAQDTLSQKPGLG